MRNLLCRTISCLLIFNIFCTPFLLLLIVSISTRSVGFHRCPFSLRVGPRSSDRFSLCGILWIALHLHLMGCLRAYRSDLGTPVLLWSPRPCAHTILPISYRYQPLFSLIFLTFDILAQMRYNTGSSTLSALRCRPCVKLFLSVIANSSFCYALEKPASI